MATLLWTACLFADSTVPHLAAFVKAEFGKQHSIQAMGWAEDAPGIPLHPWTSKGHPANWKELCGLVVILPQEMIQLKLIMVFRIPLLSSDRLLLF